jgi:hypothetical protein
MGTITAADPFCPMPISYAGMRELVMYYWSSEHQARARKAEVDM